MKTLKLSRSAYFRHLLEGMPSIGYGHMRRFRLEEVLAWMREEGARHDAARRARAVETDSEYQGDLIAV